MPYYAVAHGSRPGVYACWQDGESAHYKKRDFRVFFCHLDALRFAYGPDRSRNNSVYDCAIQADDAQEGKRYYTVTRGHIPGIYSWWLMHWLQRFAYPHPEYKNFRCWRDADSFMRTRQVQNYCIEHSRFQYFRKYIFSMLQVFYKNDPKRFCIIMFIIAIVLYSYVFL